MSYRGIADHPGLEPGTLELTALCSAIELMVKSGPAQNRTVVLHTPTCGFAVQSTPFQALTLEEPKLPQVFKSTPILVDVNDFRLFFFRKNLLEGNG